MRVELRETFTLDGRAMRRRGRKPVALDAAKYLLGETREMGSEGDELIHDDEDEEGEDEPRRCKCCGRVLDKDDEDADGEYEEQAVPRRAQDVARYLLG